MSIGRIPGAGPPPAPSNLPVPGSAGGPAAPAASGTAGTSGATPAHEHHHHAHFKGALFEHGGHGGPMRRGPTPRMPLRSPAGKRGAGRARPAAGGAIDEGEAEHSEETHVPDEVRLLQVRIQPQSEQDGSQDESNEGRRDEKRFERIFQRAPVFGKLNEGALHAVKDAGKSLALPPDRVLLPPLHSLEDVMRFIHAATQTDPGGKSIAVLLRRINAAVLRNEIKLPIVTRVSEARAALIDAFGTGHDGRKMAGESLRSVHAMLPLWLINLSKRRTALQQTHAAARLSIPTPRSGPKAD